MPEHPNTSANAQDSRIIDLAIRLLFLGLFIYSAVIMIAPLASIVLWAVILGVALYPVFHRLAALLGGRKSLAATILVLIGLFFTLGPVASAISGMADVGATLSEQAEAGTLQVPPPPESLATLPLVGPQLTEIWTLFEQNLSLALRQYAPQIIEVSEALFGRVLSVGVGLLSLALSVIIMGVLLSPGPNLVSGIQTFANRIFAPRGGEFILIAGATIQNVMKGVVGVAVIQSFLVWVLLAAFGIGSAATLALICLILSIIQVGPTIVLLPVIIYAWSTMSGGTAALFTLLAVPVAIMDNFLRPMLISKGLQTPMLVILIGVLGGMMAYGLIGIFMGPVLLAVFYELFKVWLDAEAAGQKAASDAVQSSGDAP